MALARKCDRCDSFYLEKEECVDRPTEKGRKIFKVITESGDMGSLLTKYDLCPSCAYAFVKFMNWFKEDE